MSEGAIVWMVGNWGSDAIVFVFVFLGGASGKVL